MKIILINYLFSLLLLQIQCNIGQDGVYTMHDDEFESKNVSMKRYVVEDEYFPPIFGSYKYNPVVQQFDLPQSVYNATSKDIHVDNVPTSTTVHAVFKAQVTSLKPGKNAPIKNMPKTTAKTRRATGDTTSNNVDGDDTKIKDLL